MRPIASKGGVLAVASSIGVAGEPGRSLTRIVSQAGEFTAAAVEVATAAGEQSTAACHALAREEFETLIARFRNGGVAWPAARVHSGPPESAGPPSCRAAISPSRNRHHGGETIS